MDSLGSSPPVQATLEEEAVLAHYGNELHILEEQIRIMEKRKKSIKDGIVAIKKVCNERNQLQQLHHSWWLCSLVLHPD